MAWRLNSSARIIYFVTSVVRIPRKLLSFLTISIDDNYTTYFFTWGDTWDRKRTQKGLNLVFKIYDKTTNTQYIYMSSGTLCPKLLYTCMSHYNERLCLLLKKKSPCTRYFSIHITVRSKCRVERSKWKLSIWNFSVTTQNFKYWVFTLIVQLGIYYAQ
jgi:hypothetical protein